MLWIKKRMREVIVGFRDIEYWRQYKKGGYYREVSHVRFFALSPIRIRRVGGKPDIEPCGSTEKER
jgi:hypothetical protein